MGKSKLKVKTSFVSPVTLRNNIEEEYLPIFIIRSIERSDLIGKYSGTSIHFKSLSPSAELFRAKRDGKIGSEKFKELYLQEISNTDLTSLVRRFEYLAQLSGAKGIILLSYGSDSSVCHRSALAQVLNESGLLEEKVDEIIL